MKIGKGVTAILLSALLLLSLAACSQSKTKLDIDKPDSISAVEKGENEPMTTAIEPSENVNGKRFSLTLYEFSDRYNAAKRMLGDTDLIIADNWKKTGEPLTDNHGVKIQYYYYDDDNVNLTATVETESEKLMNIGLGTTMSNFMAQESGENNSDEILRKAAIMAEAACCFGSDKIDTLQNVFYQIATGSDDSMWYDGFVFSLSTQDKKSDSKNSVMLFRVFPVTTELKKEWKLPEYNAKQK